VINQLTSQHESHDNALSLRSKDPEKAWEHVTSAAVIATRTLNSVKFTGDYQKVGVKSPQWQDIHTLVEAAANEVLPISIQVSNTIPAGTEIYADPLIGKVFSNLIENTVKYGEKATTIRFSIHPGSTGSLIVCEDDGVGIPEGKKEKLFSYEHGMSNGLGLFLAREILAITAITLRETGTPGSGARFEIHCPANILRGMTDLSG
jgi:K+-sensing histidine kinase KdpD